MTHTILQVGQISQVAISTQTQFSIWWVLRKSPSRRSSWCAGLCQNFPLRPPRPI